MTGKTDADDLGSHISISPMVFALLLGSAGLGGLGGGSFIAPAVDRQAVAACIDNSQTALGVAAQHGAEIQTIRQLIWDRTQDRWTSDDALESERNQSRINQEIFRRLEYLEDRMRDDG